MVFFLSFWYLFHFLSLFLKEEMPLESQWERLVRRRLTAMASVCHSLLSVPSMRVTQHGVAWVWWRVGVVLFCFGFCLVLLSAFPMCAVTVVYLSTFSGDSVSSGIAFAYTLPEVENQEWGGENNTLKLSFWTINVVSKYDAVIDWCSVALVCKHNRETGVSCCSAYKLAAVFTCMCQYTNHHLQGEIHIYTYISLEIWELRGIRVQVF